MTTTRGEAKMTIKRIEAININKGDMILIEHSDDTDYSITKAWHDTVAETLEGTGIQLFTTAPHAQLTVLKQNNIFQQLPEAGSYTKKIVQSLEQMEKVVEDKEAISEYKKLINSISEAVEKIIKSRISMSIKSQEYIKSLENENELQEEKSDFLENMELDILKMGIESLIGERLQDSNLLLTDGKNHTTFFRVENRGNLAKSIHDFAVSLIGDEYKIDHLPSDSFIAIKSLDGDKAYYLINYDVGTVVV